MKKALTRPCYKTISEGSRGINNRMLSVEWDSSEANRLNTVQDKEDLSSEPDGASHDENRNDAMIKKTARRSQRDTGLPPIYATSYSSVEGVLNAIEIHEIERSTEYVNRSKATVDGDMTAIVKAVRNEFQRSKTIVNIRCYTVPRIHPRIKIDNPDLIPFIVLGHASKLCRYHSKCGSELNKNTLKTGCEAIIKILQVVFFPKYKVPTEDGKCRKSIIEKLRNDLIDNISVDMTLTWYMAIKDIHIGHPTGENARSTLRTDYRLPPQIEKLVCRNTFSFRDVQSHLKSFVEGLITAKAIPRPDPSSTRFYPTGSSIRGYIRSFRMKHEKLGNRQRRIALQITGDGIRTARRSGGLSAKLSCPYQAWPQRRSGGISAKLYHSTRQSAVGYHRRPTSRTSRLAPSDSKRLKEDDTYTTGDKEMEIILKSWADEDDFKMAKREPAEGKMDNTERQVCKSKLVELIQQLDTMLNTVLKSVNESIAGAKSLVKHVYEADSHYDD